MLSSAQNYLDIIKVDYGFSPNNRFEDTLGKTHLQDVNGELTIPVRVYERANFLTGMYFEFNSASFNPSREQESVYGTILKLGMNIKHSNKWSGTYMFLPKISSDCKKIEQNDFQYGGFVLMQYTQSSRLNYRIGLYANGDKFGPFFVPLLGIYYLSKNEKIEIKGVLPLNFDMNFSLSNNIRLGMNYRGLLRTFNLNTPIGNEQNRYIVKATNELSLYFQYGFSNGINIQLACGRSLGRSYRIFNEKVNWGMPLYYNGDNRTQLNTDFSDGWIFKVALFYRIPLKS